MTIRSEEENTILDNQSRENTVCLSKAIILP